MNDPGSSLLPVAIGLLLLVAGAVLITALIYSRRGREELDAHIAMVVRRGSGLPAKQVAAASAAESGWRLAVGARLRHGFAIGLAQHWGMRAGPVMLIALALSGAAGGWLLMRASLQFSALWAGPAAAAMFFLLPRLWLKREQGRANQRFVSLFPDAIDMMIRMLRAGMPVTSAIRAVGIEAPSPVDRVFSQIADQMGIGITFEDALATAAEQVGLPDFRFFAVAISLQRATGGNLAVTLDILSDIMRKRRAMRLKAKAVTGEVRMSAYVLGSMPVLVIGALMLVSPDYLTPLLIERRGNIIIGVAALMMLVGFGTIRMMMRSVTNV
jgi:tight adherence protein B